MSCDSDALQSVTVMSGQRGGLDALLQRPRPSLFQQFVREPCIFIAEKLYNWRLIIASEPINPVAVVCISDTHNHQPSETPAGEILVHAGDLTQSGTLGELQASLNWINSCPHLYKIVIAGNHDLFLDHTLPHADPAANKTINWGDIIYLNSESTTIFCNNGRRLRIYGSPLTPRHGNWAFQYSRNQDVWHTSIPEDVDILVTHGPPKGHLDAGYLGCKHLLKEVWRTKPRLHIFGHVHDGYGMEWVQYDRLQKAYENTVMASGGLWNLVRVLFEFVVAHVNPVKESRTLFVNAAMVGGLRDEQRRVPITVHV